MLAGNFNPVLFLYQQFWLFLDLLYPPVCGGCNKPGTRWCAECEGVTRILKEPLCQICGVSVLSTGLCPECQQSVRIGLIIRSWAVFEGPLRSAIHRLKYNNDVGLADIFSRNMTKAIQELDWNFDLVIPVPLTRKRKKERGFNQSALLARPIAMSFRKPLCQDALIRTRDTVSQTKLNADERRKNVAKAFQADSQRVSGLKILLVDDLATTGATLEACTSALLEAGSEMVYSFTLARTL